MISLGSERTARRKEPHHGATGKTRQPKLVSMDITRGRLSLAFQEIAEIPRKYIDKYGEEIKELDLTCNQIRDFQFLTDVPNLETLILDRNKLGTHTKFPLLLQLTTLSVNHNAIDNLSTFIGNISKSCPNLKFFSMMNNEAAPSCFNGGSDMQYQDYRHYVISQLHELHVLDDTTVKTEELAEAGRVYGYRRATTGKKKRRKTKSCDFPDVFADTKGKEIK